MGGEAREGLGMGGGLGWGGERGENTTDLSVLPIVAFYVLPSTGLLLPQFPANG